MAEENTEAVVEETPAVEEAIVEEPTAVEEAVVEEAKPTSKKKATQEPEAQVAAEELIVEVAPAATSEEVEAAVPAGTFAEAKVEQPKAAPVSMAISFSNRSK